MTHIKSKEHKSLNWLLIDDRFNQWKDVLGILLKYIINLCKNRLNEIPVNAPQNFVNLCNGYIT